MVSHGNHFILWVKQKLVTCLCANRVMENRRRRMDPGNGQ